MVLARGEVSRTPNSWCSGTGTRCCAARSAGSATSRATGYGFRPCPGRSPGAGGARCSRLPRQRCPPGTGAWPRAMGRHQPAASRTTVHGSRDPPQTRDILATDNPRGSPACARRKPLRMATDKTRRGRSPAPPPVCGELAAKLGSPDRCLDGVANPQRTQRTSTRSPRDSPPVTRKAAGHIHDRVFEPHRYAAGSARPSMPLLPAPPARGENDHRRQRRTAHQDRRLPGALHHRRGQACRAGTSAT